MSEVISRASASDRVLSTAELLEQILVCLLEDIFPKTEHEDPRSPKTQANASILLHLVHCSQVNRIWHQCIFRGSKPIQRALFLREDHLGPRSWQVGRPWYPSQRDYHQDLAFRIPVLNPIVRATLPTYRFRFWKNAAEAWGPRYRAYLIVRRKDAVAARERLRSGQGRTLSKMFLSQPPATEMVAAIWEREVSAGDETTSPSRTTELNRPVIKCDQGVTLGFMHKKIFEMFDEHKDVTAIKVTTV